MKSSSPNSLLLIGAGGHARSVMGCIDMPSRVAGYADPLQATDVLLRALRRMGDDGECIEDEEANLMDAIITAGVGSDGSLKLRRRLIELYGERRYATIIAPTAVVVPTAAIGAGTVVMHMAVVNSCTTLGRHCVVNTGAIVEHDCIIGENVFIGPGAVVCGGAEIGNDVFIGAHATVRPGIHICSDTIVGMGAAVCGDISVAGTYTGLPAMRI